MLKGLGLTGFKYESSVSGRGSCGSEVVERRCSEGEVDAGWVCWGDDLTLLLGFSEAWSGVCGGLGVLDSTG